MGSRAMGRRITLAALALSAFGPLALLVLVSLGDRWVFPSLLPPALTADSWRAVTDGQLARAAATSGLVAIATAIASCALALPVGRAMARLAGWRRHVASAAAFAPVIVPPIALGLGLQYGFVALGLGSTTAGVILAHTVPATSFLAIYFSGVFTALDPGLEDEARSLGATPLETWRRITIPLIRRPIAEALALGFLISWSQVPLSLVIGGGVVHTLPLAVYDYVRSGEARYAATGALLLTVPPVLALFLAL
jgi:putative spermidine/putrescine transport system permease protein